MAFIVIIIIIISGTDLLKIRAIFILQNGTELLEIGADLL